MVEQERYGAAPWAAISSTTSSGSSEVQRLLRNIQVEGITVLSLSERLFLMRHSRLGRELAPPSLGDGGGWSPSCSSKMLQVLHSASEESCTHLICYIYTRS